MDAGEAFDDFGLSVVGEFGNLLHVRLEGVDLRFGEVITAAALGLVIPQGLFLHLHLILDFGEVDGLGFHLLIEPTSDPAGLIGGLPGTMAEHPGIDQGDLRPLRSRGGDLEELAHL